MDYEQKRLKQLDERRAKMLSESNANLKDWYAERMKEDGIFNPNEPFKNTDVPNFQAMDLDQLQVTLDKFNRGIIELSEPNAKRLIEMICQRRFAKEQKRVRGDSARVNRKMYF